MATPNRTTLHDLRGAARLAVDATVGITDLVEKMHHTIQLVHPPLGASRADSTRGLTGLIYRTIRGTTRLVGKGLDAGLAPMAALFPEGESPAARDHWVSAINGVYGDHLEQTGNPLAIEMGFRHGGQRVEPERPAETIDDAAGKLLVIVHGLCMNDLQWTRDGDNRIEAVAAERGYTPVYLRYNTGRSIAANGRDFSDLLETLLTYWPEPVQELAIVGHSMGGLVARSASHHGRLAGHAWRASLRRLVFLGTPHHGAPLERGGHWLDYVMELSPYVAPFTSLGKARSAGITDLRYGSITDDDAGVRAACRTTSSAMRSRPRSASAAASSPSGWLATAWCRSTARSAGTGMLPGRSRSRRSASGSATKWDTSSCWVAPRFTRNCASGWPGSP